MDINHLDFQQPNIQKLNQQLLNSASQGNEDEVLQCILSGASVYVTDCFGLTPLMLAAKNGHATVINILIENESEIEMCCSGKKSALMYSAEHAIKSKNCDGLITLLKVGANFETHLLKFRDYYDGAFDLSNPVSWGSYHGLTKALNYFLKNSAEMNPIETVELKQGYTPLILAVAGGHVDTVKFLIDSGANYDLIDNQGKDLVEIALGRHNVDMLRYLLLETKFFPVDRKNKTKISYLHLAIDKRSLDLVRVIIKAKPNLNELGYNNNTVALFQALSYRCYDIANELLDSGVDPIFGGVQNTSPLKYLYNTTRLNVNTIHIENKNEYTIYFRFFSCLSNESIKDFIRLGASAEKLVCLFDQEMKAIRTRQLAAFGLAESKGFLAQLKDYGYGLSTATLLAIGAIKEEPELPTLPRDMVKLIICDPTLYPTWYAHRIQKDIDTILNNFNNAKLPTPFTIASLAYNPPSPVVFSSGKRKVDDYLDSDIEKKSTKKFKSDDT